MVASRATNDYPSDSPSKLQRAFALSGVFGPIMFWGILLLLDVLRADYSNLSNQVSEIGALGAPYGDIGRGMFLSHGVLLIAFAVGLARDLWGTLMKPGAVALLLVGTASLAAGVFPLDPARPAAVTNTAHGLFILPGSVAAIVAPFLVARRMRSDDRWQSGYYYATVLMGGLLLALFLGPVFLLATNSEPSWFSERQQLVGRAHHATLNLWVFVLALHMFRLARTGQSPPER